MPSTVSATDDADNAAHGEHAAEARTEGRTEARGERRYRYPRTPFVPRPRVGFEDGSELPAEASAVDHPAAVATPPVPPAPAVPMPVVAAPALAVPAAAAVDIPDLHLDAAELAPKVIPMPQPVATPVSAPIELPLAADDASSSLVVRAIAGPAMVSAPAAAPVVAPMHPLPPAPLKLDWSSGLTQIETDSARVEAAQAAAVVEPPRKPRVRPLLPPVSDEPLLQVETQHHEASGQTV